MRKLIEERQNLKEAVSQYKTLNDAEVYDPGLGKGQTEIWYAKRAKGTGKPARDLMMGVEWCRKHDCLPKPGSLEDTHTMLGEIKMKKKDDIFMALQGENWSPEGESKSLIRKKGLAHTSISVGDIVKMGSQVWMVDMVGYKKLGNKEAK
jgi:hypothetical protein